MDISVLSLLVAGATALASALAWLAKLGWAKEYRAAKDELVRVKDAQIQQLESQVTQLEALAPPVIQKHHETVRQQLSDVIQHQKHVLGEKTKEHDELRRQMSDVIARLVEVAGLSNEHFARLPVETMVDLKEILFWVSSDDGCDIARKRFLATVCVGLLASVQERCCVGGVPVPACSLSPSRPALIEKFPGMSTSTASVRRVRRR